MSSEERVTCALSEVERLSPLDISASSTDAELTFSSIDEELFEPRLQGPTLPSPESAMAQDRAPQASVKREREALAGQFALEEIHLLLDLTVGDFRLLTTGPFVAGALADHYGWECEADVPPKWHPFMRKLCALNDSQVATLVGVLKQVWRVEMRKPEATDLRSCVEAAGLNLSA